MTIQPEDVGKRAVIRFCNGDVRAEGKVLAHSLAPEVLILTDDGERIHWRHDMGDVTPDDPSRFDADVRQGHFVVLVPDRAHAERVRVRYSDGCETAFPEHSDVGLSTILDSHERLHAS